MIKYTDYEIYCKSLQTIIFEAALKDKNILFPPKPEYISKFLVAET